MPNKKTELELIKTIADRAMEIHRKNKKVLPLAIYEAVSEVGNTTEARRIELRKETHRELVRRSLARRKSRKKVSSIILRGPREY